MTKRTSVNAGLTEMEKETRESSSVVARQLEDNKNTCKQLGAKLREIQPGTVVTCARGSSDHACSFAKYLFETRLGLITSSSAPSVSSLYGQGLQMRDTLFIAVSQSGQSPDIVENTRQARQNGAFVIVLVNQAGSPLEELADIVVPLHAGKEHSVAATKTFIASLTALVHIVACWSGDENLLQGLEVLPEALLTGLHDDWREALAVFSRAGNTLIVGRGPGFGIAQEAALKFKETATLHAEAFSAAEIKHGPMALVGEHFPILVFRQRDESYQSVGEMAGELRHMGADVMVAQEGPSEPGRLAVSPGLPPILSLLVMIQSFYLLANEVALCRGLNPDQPRHLKKVTETR